MLILLQRNIKPERNLLQKMSDSDSEIMIVGGWSTGVVTPEVVAGTNYEFEVEGSSASHNQVSRFLVKVFDQPWTNTTELTSVVAAPAPQ
ncbi:hypothetical protein PF008_g3248 [Phytophthora fragariae]|uniref:Cystatin domain-containing protein n=1 Tax=Phytophthora fragariae TaxID=53985 RepID=A0A6G0SGL5_9STRA|nr:hypothetical protein PF008_g3248 [Phytophthora fragariae]